MARKINPFLTAAINHLWFGERSDSERPLLDLAVLVRDAIPHVDADLSTQLQTILAQCVLSDDQVEPLHDIARGFAPEAPVPTDEGHALELRRRAYEIVRRSREESSRADPDAIATIENVVNLMKTAHPELHLSFGYIGNLPSGGWDDRSWKVFTKLATVNAAFGCDVSFGGHHTRDLPAMATRVSQNLQAWCATQSERLEAGELRSLAKRSAA